MTVQRHRSNFGDLVTEDQSDESEDEDPVELIRPADPKLRALISNFFNTFQGMELRASVYGLDIAGMIDHTEGEHKGHCSILYRLPGTIGIQSRQRPAENLKLRAPVTLQSLLGDITRQGVLSTLGTRFELARKLVRAVCLLHSSGWLHKNIRAESVMFFPEHVSALQEDRYEKRIEIDVSKPILMGYIFSRPDDIVTRTDTPLKPVVMEVPRLPRLPPPPPPPPPPGVAMPHQTHGVFDLGPARRKVRVHWADAFSKDLRIGAGLRPARPDGIYGRNMLERGHMTGQTDISGFTLDYYQHPAKHADPKRLYRHAYDVYSLGVLLLEVGLWERLKSFEDSNSDSESDYEEEDHYEKRRWICREYLDQLRWVCGAIYADVVPSCPTVDSSDEEVGQASERELCARLVADLEGCRA